MMYMYTKVWKQLSHYSGKEHTTVQAERRCVYVKFVGDNVDRYLGVRILSHRVMKRMFSLLAV